MQYVKIIVTVISLLMSTAPLKASATFSAYDISQELPIMQQIFAWNPAEKITDNAVYPHLLNNPNMMNIFLKNNLQLQDIIAQNLLTENKVYFCESFKLLVRASNLVKTSRPIWEHKQHFPLLEKNYQPIHKAAQLGSISAIQTLLTLQADINAVCKIDSLENMYETALDISDKYGHQVTSGLLREKGALTYKQMVDRGHTAHIVR